MAANKLHLETQIAELTRNLELIEVRKSQFVQPTDIPLQLIKDEADTRARLEALKRQLAALPADTPDTTPSRGQPPLLLAGVIGVLILAVGIAFWLRGPGSTPPAGTASAPLTPEPTVTAAPSVAPTSTVAATPTATEASATEAPATDGPAAEASATPPSAQPGPHPPVTFTSLPAAAPVLTTTVVLLQSPLCSPEMESLAGFLNDTTSGAQPPVMKALTTTEYASEADRAAVRSLGVEAGADLVIWCMSSDGGAAVQIEALTQRGAPDVYEPQTIALPLSPRVRMQRAVYGAVAYAARDYAQAESALRTALDTSPEPEAAAALQLLLGNAQIQRRAYAPAAETYRELVAAQPASAFAWHNLGVAELYAAWNSHEFGAAQAALAEARTLDPTFDLPLVAQARIYRRTVDEVAGSFEQAVNACRQAQASLDSRTAAQGLVCLNLMQLIGRNLDDSAFTPQFASTDTLQEAATAYWADPLAIAGAVEADYWDANGDQVARQRARALYTQYLNEAVDDVQLEESRGIFRDTARLSLSKLDENEP